MDIHRPKHPVVSIRSFLTEMFTVTCGIVIALGLEALVVAHHDGRLRTQAVADFRAEIAAGQQRLQTMLQAAPADGAMITTLLAYGTQRLAHQHATLPAGQSFVRSFAFLATDSWQTALATQAVAQLSFEQVRALAGLHAGEVVFNDFEARARDQWVGIAAFGDPSQLGDDEVRQAMQALRVAYAYQASLAAQAQDLSAKSAAAARLLGSD